MYAAPTAVCLQPDVFCFVHAALLSKAGLTLFALPDYLFGNQTGTSGLSLALQVQLNYDDNNNSDYKAFQLMMS